MLIFNLGKNEGKYEKKVYISNIIDYSCMDI